MPGIVCPIRGGTESHYTIQQAILLAKQTHLPLHFLYVVNLDFLSSTSSSRVGRISQDMQQMGEFILLHAQEEANREDVSADGAVRKGNVRLEIVSLSHEVQADYVLMGRPSRTSENDVFTHPQLEDFRETLEEQTGAQVVLLENK